MSLERQLGPAWAPFEDLEGAWARLAARFGGRFGSAGQSVEGRSLPLVELGPPGAPTVLLTGLVHGIELVGGLALLHAVERWLERPRRPRLRLAVLPVMNPDAVAENVARLREGRRAGRRSNLRGVDLNRNFARLGKPSWHPLSGSRRPGLPYFMGERAFSEPETRALAEVAHRVRPRAALGFHSFGELLLYPWAHTPAPHPRRRVYEALGSAFQSAQTGRPYDVRAAHAFYPTTGDLDDYLDHELGTLAFTVEVGRPCRRLLHPRRLVDAFHWMNPVDPGPALAPAVDGTLALLEAVARPAIVEREPPRRAYSRFPLAAQ